jgi:transposase
LQKKNEMATLKNEQKKALAKDIYLLGSYTLEEIAQKVDATRQTVSRWAKTEGWDELKAGMTIGREQILKSLYRQINEINSNISKRAPGERHASIKEADILAKLSAAIKKMEEDVGISDLISSGMRFGDWLRTVDIEKAKEFINYWDAFIKDQI